MFSGTGATTSSIFASGAGAIRCLGGTATAGSGGCANTNSSRAIKVPPPSKPAFTSPNAPEQDCSALPQAWDYTLCKVKPEFGEHKLSQPEFEVIADIRGFCEARSNVEAQVKAFIEMYVEQLKLGKDPKNQRERNNILLARELTSKGYAVTIRHHEGFGTHRMPPGRASPFEVRDTYVVFTGVPGAPRDEFVIELDFRDRFNIASPTPFYSTCLEAVPETWVGPMEQLLPLVELLCSEMSMAFEERQLDMPPWRHHEKVASRWKSADLKSFSVDSTSTLGESPVDLAEVPVSCSSQHGLGSKAASDTLSHALNEAGLTLTPLSSRDRTCSISFDKIDLAPAPLNEGGLKKATSLLAMHLMGPPSPKGKRPPSKLVPRDKQQLRLDA